MADGFEWTIFEIFEIILATSLFLILGSAIFFVSDVNYVKAQAISLETSYTASLLSGKNGTVEINYPEVDELNLAIKDNELTVTIADNDKFEIKRNYIGNRNVEIKKETNKITIVSNG